MPVDFLIAGLIKWIWLINGNQSEFNLIHQQRQLMKPALIMFWLWVIRYRMSWFHSLISLAEVKLIHKPPSISTYLICWVCLNCFRFNFTPFAVWWNLTIRLQWLLIGAFQYLIAASYIFWLRLNPISNQQSK